MIREKQEAIMETGANKLIVDACPYTDAVTVEVLPEADASIAKTDGKTLWVCGTKHPFVRAYPQGRLYQYMLRYGLVLHEAGHVLYTDFKQVSDLFEKEDALDRLGVRNIVSEFEAEGYALKKVENAAKSVVFPIFFNVHNIIEDGHLERRLLKEMSSPKDKAALKFMRLVFRKFIFENYKRSDRTPIETFGYEVAMLALYGNLVYPARLVRENPDALQGKTFVLTGKLSKPRDQFVTRIQHHGGFVANSVTDNTDFLLTSGNINSTKSRDASRHGTLVISEAEFEGMLKPIQNKERVLLDVLESETQLEISGAYERCPQKRLSKAINLFYTVLTRTDVGNEIKEMIREALASHAQAQSQSQSSDDEDESEDKGESAQSQSQSSGDEDEGEDKGEETDFNPVPDSLRQRRQASQDVKPLSLKEETEVEALLQNLIEKGEEKDDFGDEIDDKEVEALMQVKDETEEKKSERKKCQMDADNIRIEPSYIAQETSDGTKYGTLKAMEDSFFATKQSSCRPRGFDARMRVMSNEGFDATEIDEATESANAILQAVSTALAVEKDTAYEGGAYTGTMLDMESVISPFPSGVFSDPQNPSEEIDATVTVLIDVSGSMAGRKIKAARKTALIIYKICKALGVPITVGGYDNNYYYCCDASTPDFEPGGEKLIASLYASGGTYDAPFLLWQGTRLIQRKESRKIFFLICDGDPSDGYGRSELAAIARYLSANQVELVVAGLDAPDLKDIYGEERYMEIQTPQDIEAELPRILMESLRNCL